MSTFRDYFPVGFFGVWLVLVLMTIAGWITNVITVIGLISDSAMITFYSVFCMIGVVVAPLGGILGVLS